jgi:hypothetical protein
MVGLERRFNTGAREVRASVEFPREGGPELVSAASQPGTESLPKLEQFASQGDRDRQNFASS